MKDVCFALLMPYHPCMACLPIHLVGLHGKCRYRYISDMDPMGQNSTNMAGVCPTMG